MTPRSRNVVQVIVRSMRKMWPIAAIPLVLLSATPAWAVGGTVTPNPVNPGGTVTVAGTVPVGADECPVPGIVILEGTGTWADPYGFEAGPYDSTGLFNVSGHLSPTISTGTHVFLIRCTGRSGPLGPGAGAEIGGPAADATFTVRDVVTTGAGHLERTGLNRSVQAGGHVGSQSDVATATLVLAVIVLGVAAVVHRRRWLLNAHWTLPRRH